MNGLGGTQPPSTTKWAMNSTEYQKYVSIYTSKTTHPTMVGPQARELFVQSGLPSSTLFQIWKLADPEQSGQLDPPRFAVAMHLIFLRLAGAPVPSQLPGELDPERVAREFGEGSPSIPKREGGGLKWGEAEERYRMVAGWVENSHAISEKRGLESKQVDQLESRIPSNTVTDGISEVNAQLQATQVDLFSVTDAQEHGYTVPSSHPPITLNNIGTDPISQKAALMLQQRMLALQKKSSIPPDAQHRIESYRAQIESERRASETQIHQTMAELKSLRAQLTGKIKKYRESTGDLKALARESDRWRTGEKVASPEMKSFLKGLSISKERPYDMDLPMTKSPTQSNVPEIALSIAPKRTPPPPPVRKPAVPPPVIKRPKPQGPPPIPTKKPPKVRKSPDIDTPTIIHEQDDLSLIVQASRLAREKAKLMERSQSATPTKPKPKITFNPPPASTPPKLKIPTHPVQRISSITQEEQRRQMEQQSGPSIGDIRAAARLARIQALENIQGNTPPPSSPVLPPVRTKPKHLASFNRPIPSPAPKENLPQATLDLPVPLDEPEAKPSWASRPVSEEKPKSWVSDTKPNLENVPRIEETEPISETVPVEKLAEEEPIIETAPAEEEPIVEMEPVEKLIGEEPILESVPAEEEPTLEFVPEVAEPITESVPVEAEPIPESVPVEEVPILEPQVQEISEPQPEESSIIEPTRIQDLAEEESSHGMEKASSDASSISAIPDPESTSQFDLETDSNIPGEALSSVCSEKEEESNSIASMMDKVPSFENPMRGVALYEFASDDFSILPGQIVLVVGFPPDGPGWCLGYVEGTAPKESWIPKDYLDFTAEPPSNEQPDGVWCKLLEDFSAEVDGGTQMFSCGLVVEILDTSDPDWHMAKHPETQALAYLPADLLVLQGGTDQTNPFSLNGDAQGYPSDTETGSLHSRSQSHHHLALGSFDFNEDQNSQRQGWASQVDPAILAGLSSQEIKRHEAIHELVATEKQYLRDMQLVLEVFYLPLESQEDREQLELLFSNLPDLIVINTMFLSQLEAASADEVGSVFLDHAPALVAYGTYCGNHAAASRYLQHPPPQLDTFLREAQELPRCRMLSLTSFLLQPVQRITRYPLLLNQILKYTTPDQPDHAPLDQAYQKAKSLLDEINSCAQASEDAQQLREHMNAIDLTSYPDFDLQGLTRQLGPRRAIMDGPLSKYKSGRGLHGFLFNDIFILTQPALSGSPYRFVLYRPPMPLVRLKARDAQTTQGRRGIFSPYDESCFQLIHGKDILTLKTATPSTTKKWMSEFNKAIQVATLTDRRNPGH